MKFHDHTIVLCHGVRTPFGALGKELADMAAEDMMAVVFQDILRRAHLTPRQVDGLMVGWVGEDSHALNIARVTALRMGFPVETPALTLQANCMAGLEAVCAAVGRIVVGDGELYLVGGTESMSQAPFAIRGVRSNAFLRNLATVKSHWAEILQSSQVSVVDMMEEGLTDPVAHINMGATAEVLAQLFHIGRKEQDEYALESIRRTVRAVESGFYQRHLVPVTREGATILTADETPTQRQSVLEKPKLMEKAPTLFDNGFYPFENFYRDHEKFLGSSTPPAGSGGSVTLLNSCGRSDGAAGLIVTTRRKALELNLDIIAEVASWAFRGVEPHRMGLAPAVAAQEALVRAGLSFDQIDTIELHEPFAAGVLALFQFAKTTFGHDWRTLWEKGNLNPKGGTLALGHPIAATGVRVLLNLAYAMGERPGPSWGLGGACASGGMGGAMVLRNGKGGEGSTKS